MTTAHQDYVHSAKGQLERVRILKAKNAYFERLKLTLETFERSTQAQARPPLAVQAKSLQAKLMEVCHVSACLALFQYLSTWWLSISDSVVAANHKYDASSPIHRVCLDAALKSLEPVLMLLRDRYTKGYGPCQEEEGLKHNNIPGGSMGTRSFSSSSSLVGDLREECTAIPSRMCKDRESRLLSWRLSLEHGTIDAFQSQVASVVLPCFALPTFGSVCS